MLPDLIILVNNKTQIPKKTCPENNSDSGSKNRIVSVVSSSDLFFLIIKNKLYREQLWH